MNKIPYILALMLLLATQAHATHNRAGEITVIQTGKLSFKIQIKTFTYSLSAADRSELEVQWGDETVSVARRYQKLNLPNFYYENHYEAEHTYPGPGLYTIIVQDPNRNDGVLNIPNSVNVIFSISTSILINPFIGKNNTPVLLNPPIDRAAYGHRFVHNPAAYDPDGDSISYELTVCTEENGQPIEDYSLPDASDTLYVDGATGDLIWDAPVDTGIYNIAIKIKEWREGVIIGSINRDMQVEVYNTVNNPPQNMPLRDFCIEAGSLLEYEITSTDPDGNQVMQFATGGPFVLEDNPAFFDTVATGPGFSTSRFSWLTSCAHIRQQPYTVIVKAEDKHPEINLVDINNFNIRVMGPAPREPLALPSSSSIRLFWRPPACGNVTAYNIYRRFGPYDYAPDSCDNGPPLSGGYELIGTVTKPADTSFHDTNNGRGLSQGLEYCYRITAVWDDVEGYVSDEVCSVLVPGKPSLLTSSVTRVAADGEVLVSWARPRELDTLAAFPPYKYKISRYNDLWAQDLVMVDSFLTSDLNDTSYTDQVNTLEYPYAYSLEFYYSDSLGNLTRHGQEEVASTIYLEINGAPNENILTVNKNVPWINDSYVVYRQDPGSVTFDSIGIARADTYSDQSLVNGQKYCYQVKSLGRRSIYGRTFMNENLSHVACGTPIDTIPPCPPQLNVNSRCDSLLNILTWTNPNRSCADDVVGYRIYYSPVIDQTPGLLDSTLSETDTSYIHIPEGSVAGCYAVTAVDSFNNESDFSLIFCVPNCVEYDLPNVFTPNGDGINDIFRPSKIGHVSKVDMKIYSRWGKLVFETSDPEINWDGKHMNSNNLVSPGVYYYICDVFEEDLSGELIRNIVGFVYVYMQKDAVNPIEE